MTDFFTDAFCPFSLNDFRGEAGFVQCSADESGDSRTFLGFAEITVSVDCSHLPDLYNSELRIQNSELFSKILLQN